MVGAYEPRIENLLLLSILATLNFLNMYKYFYRKLSKKKFHESFHHAVLLNFGSKKMDHPRYMIYGGRYCLSINGLNDTPLTIFIIKFMVGTASEAE